MEVETILHGSPVSEGVAIGKLFFIEEKQRPAFPDFAIKGGQVDVEIDRYRGALDSSRQDLHKLQHFLCREGSNEAVTIIDSHIQMLDDPLITTVIEDQIRNMMRNTESVFDSVMKEYETQFQKIEDAFFQQRLVDVRDLSARIMRHLTSTEQQDSLPPEGSIICCRELFPTDTAEVPAKSIGAIVSEVGGMTSHAALIARAKGIPFVTHIEIDLLKKAGNVPVIVDGKKGIVILNPTEETLSKYCSLQKKIDDEENIMRQEVALETQTADGVPIEVSANVDSLEDFTTLHEKSPSSIGLFRTEALFFQRELIDATEDDQYNLYAKAVKGAKGLSVTFRLFDVGSDKSVIREIWAAEQNPALGCRAIRFLLQKPEWLRAQIRAILRAHKHGPIRVLFPLISDVNEVRQVKQVFLEEKHGLGIIQDIPCGAMIEVPSAVLTCDAIAKECDFLSLGTNDLQQYTLAIDRSNPRLSELYQPLHPSVVKMIAMAVNAANRQSVPLSICGEMASDTRFLELLIGLGITHFSTSPRYIPLIKTRIREISAQAAQSLASKILTLETADEVANHL
ncbi:MAG: phosphoenolpyruvate--protein phosphotransferase [Simkaniaceae bacterium]|nr:phosphoenolpyruvate--protein phosphotransferase [Simkaniaceae bacterium]